jgi:hypothetical protein
VELRVGTRELLVVNCAFLYAVRRHNSNSKTFPKQYKMNLQVLEDISISEKIVKLVLIHNQLFCQNTPRAGAMRQK